jgi:hypothetical protein
LEFAEQINDGAMTYIIERALDDVLDSSARPPIKTVST